MKKKEAFDRARRIVVKIGTQVLTTENNRLDLSVIEHLTEQVGFLIEERNIEVIIVTSGAIGAGMQVLGWEERPTQISSLQAAASIGQSRLMRVYEQFFKEEGINVGQILLTRDIFTVSERKRNAKETINTLLKLNVVPVINENDSVAVDEIKVGDNDTLSAFVAELVDADMLVIITDVDGLCAADPKKHSDSKPIEIVEDYDKLKGVAALCTVSKRGTGGMRSKVDAARYVTERGKACVILNGKKTWSIKKAFEGKNVGTVFVPK